MHAKGILVFKPVKSIKKDKYFNKKMGKGIVIGNVHKIYTGIPPN